MRSTRQIRLKTRRARRLKQRRTRRGTERASATLEALEPRLLFTAATITGVTPDANRHDAAVTASITATYDEAVDAGGAVTDMAFAVHGAFTGRIVAPVHGNTISVVGDTITFDPTDNFKPGETIHVAATDGIGIDSGAASIARVWQFRAAVAGGNGFFVDSGQSLGNHGSQAVALGDMDGDGDLDAIAANVSQGNRVWENLGGGIFTDTGQLLGDHTANDVALGDLDGDGDLDAFFANFLDGNRVWVNDGDGNFSDSGHVLGDHNGASVDLGDIDGDGDLDALVGDLSAGNHLWLNDGSGNFSNSGNVLGTHTTVDAALGDLDGDGDLDAFVTTGNEGDRAWFNVGGGNFLEGEQPLAGQYGSAVRLGDLDGDGDLDVLVATHVGASRVWINEGSGTFTDSGQGLGAPSSRGAALGDLEGDGDLDIFLANNVGPGNRVWRNDGAGQFSDTGQALGDHFSFDVALGDVDNDGDLDAFVGNYGQANRVWLNGAVVAPTFTITSPTATTVSAGTWVTVNVESNAFIASSLYTLGIDPDNIAGNGNEQFIAIDMALDNTNESYPMNTTGFAPGTYDVIGYRFDPATNTFYTDRVADGLTITPDAQFMLTGLTTSSVTTGDSIGVQYDAAGTVASSTYTLALDADGFWNNGNEQFLFLDQPLTDGPMTFNWSTLNVPAGTYDVVGYRYDTADGNFISSRLTDALTVTGNPFELTGSSPGTVTTGDVVAVDYTALGVGAGTLWSMAYDPDDTLNGNETWIFIDQTLSEGSLTHNWTTANAAPGTYDLVAYRYEPTSSALILDRLTDAVTITGEPFELTGVTANVTTGATAMINYTATGALGGSLYTLGWDEDGTWFNGNEHYISIDMALTDGAQVFNFVTTNVPAGTYDIIGYRYDPNATVTFDRLSSALTVTGDPFDITDANPSPTTAGTAVTIDWAALGTVAGSLYSLAYDADDTFNGNESYFLIDATLTNGVGNYLWDTTGLPSGTYDLVGYRYDPDSARFVLVRLTDGITIL